MHWIQGVLAMMHQVRSTFKVGISRTKVFKIDLKHKTQEIGYEVLTCLFSEFLLQISIGPCASQLTPPGSSACKLLAPLCLFSYDFFSQSCNQIMPTFRISALLVTVDNKLLLADQGGFACRLQSARLLGDRLSPGQRQNTLIGIRSAL